MKRKVTMRIKSIALAVLAAGALPLFGASYSYNGLTWQDTVSPGKWTSKYNDAKTYVKKNYAPMVVVWASPTCGYCKSFENAVGGNSAFKAWAEDRGYIFVFVLGQSANSDWGLTQKDATDSFNFASVGLTKFPFVGIWWPKKGGGEVKTRFTGRSGMMAVKSGSLAQQFMDSVDHFVGAYASVKPKSYKITFDANGGSNLSESSRIVVGGKTVGTLPTATRTNYKLTGWATAKSGGTVVKSTTKVTGEATYYAQWKKVVTLTLKDSPVGEGKLVGAGQYDEGAKVAVKTAPKNKGIFSCWKNGSTVVSQVPKFTYTLGSANVTLTAYFITKQQDYDSISLKVNSSTLTESTSAERTLEQGVKVNWAVEAGAKTVATPSVSGLPSGLKLAKDKETGAYSITGVPTTVSSKDKKGNVKPSNVTLKVKTSGGNTKTYKMAITVKARPSWTEGTFNGYACNAAATATPVGLVYNLTVAANGKISGKLLREGKTYSLSSSSFIATSPYRAEIVGKSGKETKTWTVKLQQFKGAGGYVLGSMSAQDNTWVAYSTPWKTNDKLKALAKTIAKAKPLTLPNGVTLKFGSAGVVTVKYGSYSSSSVLIPYSETPTSFDLFPYLAPKAGKFEGYWDSLNLKWDGTSFK